MLVVTYSEARQTLASVLDRAKKDGGVIIKRADGTSFRVVPELDRTSPFDGVASPIRLEEGLLEETLTSLKDEMANRY
ncbi:MAG: type II toxin-antitoxin system Phd/YefM family antitoxin [Bacteroidales bacterium]|nr:type II toxin-antitoxin system Phd/YefM family antitoxin [Bacteroidales bacterium]